MTSPEDDDLEEALRRALSAAADEVEPGTDGLDKIRARIGDRPPRPWLLSVLFGVVDRVRHWTWRGHWAWQDSLPRLGALRERRSRRSNFPRWDIRWLRLVTALAGVAVLAGIALGVQPVRHAILQASTSLNGGGGPPRGGAGTEGNGTQASGGSGAPTASGAVAGGAGRPARAAPPRRRRKSPIRRHRTRRRATRCVATALPGRDRRAKPSPTSVAPDAVRLPRRPPRSLPRAAVKPGRADAAVLHDHERADLPGGLPDELADPDADRLARRRRSPTPSDVPATPTTSADASRRRPDADADADADPTPTADPADADADADPATQQPTPTAPADAGRRHRRPRPAATPGRARAADGKMPSPDVWRVHRRRRPATRLQPPAAR